MNCDKNRVKGLPHSPYTPSLYYYSQNWKNKRPIPYPITYSFNHTGILGLYNFIEISESLKQMDIKIF